MRYSVVNGNGCICDRCCEILKPNDAIKMKFLHKDPNDSTGKYITLKSRDLCEECYIDILKEVDK